MTDQQMRDEIMTLFLAGHDTTANALTWTWYLLAQNPKAAHASEQNFAKCSETARRRRRPPAAALHRDGHRGGDAPVSAGLGRRPRGDPRVRARRLPHPARSNFILRQWVIHRDPRCFPDPERFDPERWRRGPARTGRIPRYAYFPFGGGPRVCVGAGFAMMEATLLLATIAQKFRLTLAPNQSIEPLFSVTLRPKNGIRMHLHPAPINSGSHDDAFLVVGLAPRFRLSRTICHVAKIYA